MTKTSPSSKDRLIQLVNQGLQEAPYVFDGSAWAGAQQKAWAEEIGVSDRQLRRLLKHPPFVYDCILVDGKKTTLLRLGDPGPPTNRRTAKRLAAIWRKETKRAVNKKEFGCLVGLADVWGAAAPRLLRFCIKHWPLFMVSVKNANLIANVLAEAAAAEGEEIDLLEDKYFKYPSIPVIRLYEMAAVSACKLNDEERAGHGLHKAEFFKGLGLPATYSMIDALW